MTSVSAATEGPVMVEVLMLGRYGSVRVVLDPEISTATLDVRTADSAGPSVDAIDAGVLAWDQEARAPELTPTGTSEPVVPAHPLPGGRLVARIQAENVDPRMGSRVEIVARVPVGSVVDVDTDRADVDVAPRPGVSWADVAGAAEVNVVSQGSEVRVAKAEQVYVEGASFTWVGQATDELTVRTGQGNVSIGDAAGSRSQVTVGSGDIEAHVSGAGHHDFSTGNGLVTGTIASDAPRGIQVSARDSRGPVALQDLRPTPGGEAAAGGAAAASGLAAAAPADGIAAQVAVQAAAKASYQAGWTARHEGTGDRLRDTPVGDGVSALLHEQYTQGWDDRNAMTDPEVAAVLADSHGKTPQAARPANRGPRTGGVGRG